MNVSNLHSLTALASEGSSSSVFIALIVGIIAFVILVYVLLRQRDGEAREEDGPEAREPSEKPEDVEAIAPEQYEERKPSRLLWG